MKLIKKIIERIKARYNSFIKELGKENKKAFGKGKLDCCGLNKKHTPKHSNS